MINYRFLNSQSIQKVSQGTFPFNQYTKKEVWLNQRLSVNHKEVNSLISGTGMNIECFEMVVMRAEFRVAPMLYRLHKKATPL